MPEVVSELFWFSKLHGPPWILFLALLLPVMPLILVAAWRILSSRRNVQEDGTLLTQAGDFLSLAQTCNFLGQLLADTFFGGLCQRNRQVFVIVRTFERADFHIC